MFDIAACKCSANVNCHCSDSRKIPVIVQNFLEDQRSEKKLTIDQILRKLRSQKKPQLCDEDLMSDVNINDEINCSGPVEPSNLLTNNDSDSTFVSVN